MIWRVGDEPSDPGCHVEPLVALGPWRDRAAAIRSVLVDTRPDICGLQEVWADGERNFASELAEELATRWCVRSSRPPGGYRWRRLSSRRHRGTRRHGVSRPGLSWVSSENAGARTIPWSCSVI